MIRSISFENYKSFKAKTKLDLKPITVLVGTNSSGKSSILKLFGLLSQSYLHPKPGTLLTYDGPVVDMGDFKTISHRNLGEPIKIGLIKDVLVKNTWEYFREIALDEFVLQVSDQNESFVYLKTTIKTWGTDLSNFTTNERGIKFESLASNQNATKKVSAGHHYLGIPNPDDYLESIMSTLSGDMDNLIKIFRIGYGREFTEQEIIDIIKDNLRKRYLVSIDGLRFSKIKFNLTQDLAIPPISLHEQDESITELPSSLRDATIYSTVDQVPVSEKLLKEISDEANAPYRHLLIRAAWNFIDNRVEYDICFNEIFERDEDTGNSLFLEELQDSLEKDLGIIRSIGPLRSAPRRFYTETQLKDLIFGIGAIDDLSEGNLEKLTKAVSQDLNLLGLEYDMNIHKITQSQFIPDLYALTLTDKKSGATQSYSDVGFGLSQVIPILITLHSRQSYPHPESFVIVEQPELHLHPASQTRLGDIFVDWLSDSPPNKNWAQLLLETHSEHLVRGFQVLVAKGKLSKDEIAIYYVDKDDKGNSFVKLMPLDENGAFTETWPEGFFDQAYLQAMELLAAQEN